MKTFPSKPISENALESAVLLFMKNRRWRATRNHVGIFKTEYGARISIGKKGFPDWTFTRRSLGIPYAHLMHVEMKRPGQKPKPKQAEILASLNHIGELAVWCDSIEMFSTIYLQHFPAEK